MKDLTEIQEHIIHKVKSYKNGNNSSWYRKSLRRDIQYWSDEREHIFSANALEFLKNKNVNITTLNAYNVRKKAGGEKSRPNVTLEHTTPINELIKTLLITDEKDMMEVMNQYSPCCFVTQEENDKLNKSGFRNKRPDGWKKCYEICGITLAE